MNFRTPAFGPDAAEPGPIKRDVALALPVLRLSILTANSEMDGRRSRPFPFAQKLFQPVRAQRNQGVWANRAVDVETKIARGVEQFSRDLPGLVPQTHIAQQGPVAVPGKIRAEIGKRDVLFREAFRLRVTNEFELWMFAAKIGQPGNFQQRRGGEGRVRKPVAQLERFDELLQIQAAPNLKFRGTSRPAPTQMCGQIATLILPFAMRDGQSFVRPLRYGGQIPNFVIRPPDAMPMERRFDMRLLEFGDVAGEFHLQRRWHRREIELFQLDHNPL